MTGTFIDVEPGLRMRLRIDDHTDPWTTTGTVVFVHGFGESGAAWRGWVPAFSRRHRVVRIDQRGFGESTPMPEDFPWSLDVLVSDLAQVVDRVAGGGPVHVIGAKIAGPVILAFAAAHPAKVRSLTLAGSMVKGPADVGGWREHVRSHGVASWARETMGARLGSTMPAAAVDWWVELCAATPLSTVLGLMRVVHTIDVTPLLPRVVCPTLVITTDSIRRPLALTRAWADLLPRVEVVALPGDAYHPAASDPDACAAIAAAFVARVDGQDQPPPSRR